ncbi:hypothetical protein CHARACLAT_019736 [Characodon lateralis]|uniref:Uncharacterized protein n=1 Tax=Characodon lateralis TaxID=208331 RepID=A0ABU7EP51_9TELE|nr:hypothetical protein [Characodon lateralis]
MLGTLSEPLDRKLGGGERTGTFNESRIVLMVKQVRKRLGCLSLVSVTVVQIQRTQKLASSKGGLEIPQCTKHFREVFPGFYLKEKTPEPRPRSPRKFLHEPRTEKVFLTEVGTGRLAGRSISSGCCFPVTSIQPLSLSAHFHGSFSSHSSTDRPRRLLPGVPFSGAGRRTQHARRLGEINPEAFGGKGAVDAALITHYAEVSCGGETDFSFIPQW